MNVHRSNRESELLHQQAVLARFGEKALKSSSLDNILHEACRLAGSALGTDLAKVMELQSDGCTLLIKAGVGWKPGVVGHETVKARADSSEGHALRTGKPVISENVSHETRFTYASFLRDHGVEAFVNVIIPGAEDDKPYGIFQVDSREPRHFTENDTQFLRGYANLIAATVVRFHMQDTKQQAEVRLRQSQKMEAIGQLTGGIAHDFNNMLAGIIASLELLQRRAQQQRYADIPRYASAAVNSANKAAVLTSRLLSFSRQQTLEHKLIQPNQLVADMTEMICRTVGPAIQLQTDLDANAGSIMGDAVQLESALLNLVINARDAMRQGGTLRLAVDNTTLTEGSLPSIDLPAGDYIRLSVQDNGTGMEPDVIERACDPFFTTKPQGEGTGLGLSMVYGFAKQSGGSVSIQSQPGEGTTVAIFLPRHIRTPAPSDSVARPEPMPLAKRGERVLLVEDDPIVRMTISSLLDDLGYSVSEATDSASCLAQLNAFERIDLLISDVGLPGEMNGFELAVAIRDLRPDLKVLFVTGFAKAGAVGPQPLPSNTHIMTKPFSIEALSSKVRQVLDHDN
ncbi:ATP-binding protein [Stutzerimonas marianensis]